MYIFAKSGGDCKAVGEAGAGAGLVTGVGIPVGVAEVGATGGGPAEGATTGGGPTGGPTGGGAFAEAYAAFAEGPAGAFTPINGIGGTDGGPSGDWYAGGIGAPGTPS